jgi:hypothetical protein
MAFEALCHIGVAILHDLLHLELLFLPAFALLPQQLER